MRLDLGRCRLVSLTECHDPEFVELNLVIPKRGFLTHDVIGELHEVVMGQVQVEISVFTGDDVKVDG